MVGLRWWGRLPRAYLETRFYFSLLLSLITQHVSLFLGSYSLAFAVNYRELLLCNGGVPGCVSGAQDPRQNHTILSRHYRGRRQR
ncbi:hypothetical protein BJY52DRAFT_1304600 [Lactarius psammicola]|nr:hypothetical protein BJY52DRAFT_1304600 [Lactarius psammicola]